MLKPAPTSQTQAPTLAPRPSRLRSAAAVAHLASRIHTTRYKLRKIADWNPLPNPTPGYSLILGINAPLLNLLPLHLELLAKQNTQNLHEIILVVDTPHHLLKTTLPQQLTAQYPQFKLRFHYYSPEQYLTLKKLNWSKCYSFLSWALGLSLVESRYALLHDYDAFILDPNFLESRYANITRTNAKFLGLQTYSHSQITPQDNLAATWEMIFDAQHVRNNHKPLDIFNRLTYFHHRAVNLDTFHYIQHRSRSIHVIPAKNFSTTLMHATQMICQCTHLHQQTPYLAPQNTTLLLAPYLLYAAGDPTQLENITQQLSANHPPRFLNLFNRNADFSTLIPDRLNGLRTMATTIEQALGHASLRPEPAHYFHLLQKLIPHQLHQDLQFPTLQQAA
ncbi:hypothetical protein [Poriferisphaera corsica]|uniref:hypothetical protein n=1 Tax=Poriferisphaera corsica TaxID=2528020 RepID=UPI0011A0BB28|nr:hypothetical protein [Poriferisphaera corsica]